MASGVVVQLEQLERPRRATGDEVAFYREHGWVKLERLISPEAAATLLARLEHGLSGARDRKPGQRQFKMIAHPSDEDAAIRAFAQSRELGEVASELMRCGRPGVQAVRFWADNVFVKLPLAQQGGKTPWHQDQPYTPYDRQGGNTVWIALNHIPPERGSMRFYSGSHRLGSIGRHLNVDGFDALDEYPWIADEFELSPPLDLQPGDATVHTRALLHAAPENETDEARWAYQVMYIPAETLFTGAPHGETDGLALEPNRPFDHPKFPIVYPPPTAP